MAKAGSSNRLCRDEGRATAKKRIVNCLAGTAVVLHRTPHAFDGLLRTVLRLEKRYDLTPDQRIGLV
jgi:hypothetical protein